MISFFLAKYGHMPIFMKLSLLEAEIVGAKHRESVQNTVYDDTVSDQTHEKDNFASGCEPKKKETLLCLLYSRLSSAMQFE